MDSCGHLVSVAAPVLKFSTICQKFFFDFFNFQMYFDRVVACPFVVILFVISFLDDFTSFLNDVMWFRYLVLNSVAAIPMYFMVPSSDFTSASYTTLFFKHLLSTGHSFLFLQLQSFFGSSLHFVFERADNVFLLWFCMIVLILGMQL